MKKLGLLTIAVGIALLSGACLNRSKTITIYVPDSMEWLTEILTEDMAKRNIDVKVELLPEVGTLYSRLVLEKGRPKAAVAVGLNDSLLESAIQQNLIKDSAPFDYGYLAIITKAGVSVNSFDELASLAGSVAFQDPTKAGTGRDFFLWTVKALGNEWPDYWRALKPKVTMMSDSWSGSFSSFERGEATGTVSYITDGAYNSYTKGKAGNVVNRLREGWFRENEYSVLLQDTPEARAVYEALSSLDVQNAIPLNNWMFPAHPDATLPDLFKTTIPSIGNDAVYDAKNMDADALLIQWKDIWRN